MAEYFIKTDRTKPNYLYAIISVTLVLFLLGFFGLLLIYAQRLTTIFKERVNIIAELREEPEREIIARLEEKIRQQPFTKDGSVQYISKEDAIELMREDFGEEFLKLDLPNPFFDVITFNVKAVYLQPDSLRRISALLKKESLVQEVSYQEHLIGDIAGNIRQIGFLILTIGIFFLLLAALLIHNTIRLALYANRFLIKNMELVGASWGFISRPYMWKAVLHGSISGILATGALIGLMFWARQQLPQLKAVQVTESLAVLSLILLMLGILVNLVSTYFVVQKYLGMRVDDLY